LGKLALSMFQKLLEAHTSKSRAGGLFPDAPAAWADTLTQWAWKKGSAGGGQTNWTDGQTVNQITRVRARGLMYDCGRNGIPWCHSLDLGSHHNISTQTFNVHQTDADDLEDG